MARSPTTKVSDAQLLAEIEDIIRTTPARDVIGRDNEESHIWINRTVSAVTNWDYVTGGVDVRTAADQAYSNNAAMSAQGAGKLKALLWRAHADLRLNSIGPASIAIGEGRPFDYFDEIRKIVEMAKQEVWFVDAYLNGDFVARYLPHVLGGASIRLLGREYMGALVSAAQAFAQQEKMPVEIRSSGAHHDRFLFIDGSACYQSGASFKDGAKKVTTITQIIDAFPELRAKYEAIWAAAQVEFKS